MKKITIKDYLTDDDISNIKVFLPDYALKDEMTVNDESDDPSLDSDMAILEDLLHEAETEAVMSSSNQEGSARATKIAHLADKIFVINETLY